MSMSLASRAYKILVSRYRGLLSHQRVPHRRMDGRQDVGVVLDGHHLEPLEERKLLSATFLGLSDLSDGGFASVANDVAVFLPSDEMDPDAANSVDAVIVGQGNTPIGFEAARWTRDLDGNVTLKPALGELPGGNVFSEASAVNQDGTAIVGHSNAVDGDLAFLWTEANGMVSLGDLAGGRTFSIATDIASATSNIFVGVSASTLGDEAVIWTVEDDGTVTLARLGDPVGGTAFSRANAVDDTGVVIVGQGSTTQGDEAIVWAIDRESESTTITELGDLPGGAFFSEATDVSSDGRVVVGVGTTASGREAFRWTEDGGMTSLGQLIIDSDPYETLATGTNGDGSVVVGLAVNGSETVSFIWDEVNGMRRLQDVLVDEFDLDLTGWQLTEVNAAFDIRTQPDVTPFSIEGDLTLVGTGINPSGNPEAWLATIPSLNNQRQGLLLPNETEILLVDQDLQESFLDFIEAKNIDTIYLFAGSDQLENIDFVTSRSSLYSQLLAKVHGRGVDVHGLFNLASPESLRTDGIIIDSFQNLLAYQNEPGRSADELFDGVTLTLTPWAPCQNFIDDVSCWDHSEYFDLLLELKEHHEEADTDLSFDVSMPTWFDRPARHLTRDGVERPLNEWVQDLADTVVVTVNRDRIIDPEDSRNGLIEVLRNEFEYAQSPNDTGQLVVVFNVQPPQFPLLGSDETVFEEGEAWMESLLTFAQRTYGPSPNLHGFSIVDVGTYFGKINSPTPPTSVIPWAGVVDVGGEFVGMNSDGEIVIVDHTDRLGVSVIGEWDSQDAADAYDGLYLKSIPESVAVEFTPFITEIGTYMVRIRWPQVAGVESQVPVEVHHADGVYRRLVDQNANGGHWFDLGEFRFTGVDREKVTISTAGTTGLVLADAVWFERLPTEPSSEREFVYGDSLTIPRRYHTATQLNDGKVLVAGGSKTLDLLEGLNSSEVYNPATKQWVESGILNVPRQRHTATLLSDGRVLVVGGAGGMGNNAASLDSAEIFDPMTGTWQEVAPMSQPRVEHTATLLADGRVLVVGGYDGDEHLASAELYNPDADRWISVSDLNQSRGGHAAVLLQDGKVLVAGGFDNGSGVNGSLASVEFWDPNAPGPWTQAADMPEVRGQGHTATVLADGRVLIAGGWHNRDGNVFPVDTMIFDPAIEFDSMNPDNPWETAAPLSQARSNAEAVRLPNGQVMIIGGEVGTSERRRSVEIYNPDRDVNRWDEVTLVNEARSDFTVTLLHDDNDEIDDFEVLIVGGLGHDGVVLPSSEIFTLSSEDRRLLGIDLNGQVVEVDPSTGIATSRGDTGLHQTLGTQSSPFGLTRGPDGLLYTLTSSFTSGQSLSLYSVNLRTSVAHLVGETGLEDLFGANVVLEGDLDFDPETGQLFGIARTDSIAPQLFTVDLTTGEARMVGSLTNTQNSITASFHNPTAMAFDEDGQLYVLDTQSDHVFEVDPVTAVVLSQIDLMTNFGGLGIGSAGMDFDPQSGDLYIVDGGLGSDSKLYTLNIGDMNSLTEVGSLGSVVPNGLAGLEFIPLALPTSDAVPLSTLEPIAGRLLGISSEGALVDVDTNDGRAQDASFTGQLNSSVGIAFASGGALYTITDNTETLGQRRSLYRLNRGTSQWTRIGSLGLPAMPGIVEGDLDFDPTSNQLYALGLGLNASNEITHDLLSVNLSTGQSQVVGTIRTGEARLAAMAFDASGTLYVLDTYADQILQVDPNSGNILGTPVDLSLNLGGENGSAGMDFEPDTGLLYIADGQSNAATDSLYVLDPATGQLTDVGSTGLTRGLAGLEFVPPPGSTPGSAPGLTSELTPGSTPGSVSDSTAVAATLSPRESRRATLRDVWGGLSSRFSQRLSYLRHRSVPRFKVEASVDGHRDRSFANVTREYRVSTGTSNAFISTPSQLLAPAPTFLNTAITVFQVQFDRPVDETTANYKLERHLAQWRQGYPYHTSIHSSDRRDASRVVRRYRCAR